MTPTEYRSALESLGLSQTEAGRFFGVHGVTGRRWAKDGPSPPAAKLIRLMLALRFTTAYVDDIVGAAP